MTNHMHVIREALDRFVAEKHTPTRSGAAASVGNDSPRYAVTPSGLTEDIHAIVYIPEFNEMSYGERQNLTWSYLKRHVPLEELKYLSLLRTVSAAEWEELAGLPPLDRLAHAGSVS